MVLGERQHFEMAVVVEEEEEEGVVAVFEWIPILTPAYLVPLREAV
jgi:hypothetical protein